MGSGGEKNNRKRSRRRIVAAAVLLFTLAAAWFAFRVFIGSDRVMNRVVEEIESRAEETLNAPLEMGGVSVDLIGRVVVSDIRLGAEPEPIFRAERAVVSLSLPRLLRNTDNPGDVITRVRLERPEIHILRLEGGTYNYDPILKGASGAGGRALPRFGISLDRGTLRFEDRSTEAPYPVRNVVLDDFTGKVNLRRERFIDVELKSGKANLADTVTLALKYDMRAGWKLDMKMKGAPLSTAAAVLGIEEYKVEGIAPEIEFYAEAAFTRIGNPPNFSWGGVATLGDVRFTIPDMEREMRCTGGMVRFSERVALLEDVELEAAGGRLRVRGLLSVAADNHFSGNVDFDSVSLKELAALASVRGDAPAGVMSGSALVSLGGGTASARAWVSIAGAEYRGIGFDALDGQLVLGGDRLDFGFRASRERGSLEGSGMAALKDGKKIASYTMAVDFTGIEAGELLAAAETEPPVEITGMLDGELFVRSAGGRGAPDMFGTVNASGLSAYDISNASGSVSFRYSAEELVVENLIVESGDELLLADGRVGADGELSISVDAAIGRMATVLALADRPDLEASGTLKVSGYIGGTLDAPVFRGDVEGRNVAVSDMVSDRVTGGIAYSGGVLRVSDFSVFTGEDSNVIDGTIDFDNRLLAIDVRVRNASVTGLAGLARDTLRSAVELPEDLGGIIDARATVSGSFDEPVADIEVIARNLTLYGEKIERADLTMKYDRYLDVEEGSLISAYGGEVSVSGLFDPDALDLIFEGRGIIAQEASFARGMRAEGSINVFGTVSGTTRAPVVKADFSCSDMVFFGEDFVLESGKLEYREGGLIALERAEITRGGEKYRIAGRYDLASSGLDMTLTLKDAGLETLTNMMMTAWGAGGGSSSDLRLPGGMSGALNGQVRVFSVAEQYAGVISLEGENLSVGTYPVDRLTFSGKFVGKRIEIDEFEALNELSLVQANGTLDLDRREESLLKVSATGIELEKLSEMGLLPAQAAGLMDVDSDVIIEGGAQKMIGSIYISDPSLRGVKLDRMRGQFEFDGNIVTLINLQALRGSNLIVVYADVPVKEEYRDNFEVLLNTSGIELSMINPLIGGVAAVGGIAELDDVRITGSAESPVFTGAVIVREGSVSNPETKPGITGLAGKLKFSGSSLNIEAMEGMFGNKKVGLIGGLRFSGLSIDRLELAVRDIDDLYVEYKNIYRGRADLKDCTVRYTPGRLTIMGTDGRPPVVWIHNGTFVIPTLAGQGGGGPAVQVGFGAQNFTVNVGEGLEVQSAWKNLRLAPKGKIQLSGDISNLQVKGWLTATRGYIGFYTTTFKIEETIIGFNTIQNVGIVPIFYTVARTRVEGTEITMYVSGPMVDIGLYPAYRELCGVKEGGGVSGVGVAAGIGVPTMALGEGGDIIVPVCPRARFEAFEENNTAGQAMTEQQILMKLGMIDAMSGGQSPSEVLQSLAMGAISPYVGSIIERGINLENFSINLDPNKDVLVKLEKRLTDRVSVRYERLFSRNIEELLEARYEFRKRSFLKWGIDQDSQTDYQVEYRLRF